MALGEVFLLNLYFIWWAWWNASAYDTQTFIDEISTVIDGYSFILTTRSTGLNIETVIPSLNYSVSIHLLSYRSAFQIAEKTFQGKELQIFYDEYRQES